MVQEEKVNESSSRNEDEGISLKTLFFVVRKHIIAIAVAVVAGTAIGMGGGILKDKLRPVFTASATMLVSTDEGSVGSTGSSTAQYQYSTYIKSTLKEFIKDNVVMKKVQESFPYKSVGAIKSGLSISNSTDSLIFKLTFTDRDPQVCVDVVNKVCEVSREVANSGTEDDPTYKLLYGNIATLSKAEGSSQTSSKTKYTLIGFAVGAVIAAGYIFLREYFDNSFKSSEEIERWLDLPVIASIPNYDFSDDKKNESSSKKGGK